jgi:outer membrane protein assembly factor BamB
VISTPSVSNGHVIVGTTTAVRSYTQATGGPEWGHAFPQLNITSAAVRGNAVFAVSGRWEVKLALPSGTVFWQKELARGSTALSTPAIGDGLVIVHIERDNEPREIFTARSAKTGNVVWSVGYDTTSLHGSPNSSPAIANGVVYVGSNDPKVRAFDVTDGKLLWESSLDGPAYSSPSIANGQLEIGTAAGTLYAFRLAS